MCPALHTADSGARRDIGCCSLVPLCAFSFGCALVSMSHRFNFEGAQVILPVEACTSGLLANTWSMDTATAWACESMRGQLCHEGAWRGPGLASARQAILWLRAAGGFSKGYVKHLQEKFCRAFRGFRQGSPGCKVGRRGGGGCRGCWCPDRNSPQRLCGKARDRSL